MAKEVDWAKAKRLTDEFTANLVEKANKTISESPYLLRAFNDFMDVNHELLDPILEKKWEHQMMWLLHLEFMKTSNELAANVAEEHRLGISILTDLMKNIAQTVDLALLPRKYRQLVEAWATRYKEHFNKREEGEKSKQKKKD